MKAANIEAQSAYGTLWRHASEKRTDLKSRVRAGIRHVVLDVASRAPYKIGDRFLKCLCAHYVFDDQVDRFDALLDELASIGQFVSSSEAIQILEGRKPLDRRYFHLSFDDGFRNVTANAFSVLRRKRIPATFFVPTNFIGGDLQMASRFAENENYRAPVQMCSWEDLRGLEPELFTIGAHTRNHVVLATLRDAHDRLVDELAGSKRDIEQRLGRPCEYFAWPRGKMKFTTESAIGLTRELGFRGSFGVFRGSVVPNKTNAHAIPRQHIDVQWPLRHTRFLANLLR